MKKIILILSVLLLFGITTTFSFADTPDEGSVDYVVDTYSDTENGSVKESGKLGTNITYTLYEDGTL